MGDDVAHLQLPDQRVHTTAASTARASRAATSRRSTPPSRRRCAPRSACTRRSPTSPSPRSPRPPPPTATCATPCRTCPAPPGPTCRPRSPRAATPGSTIPSGWYDNPILGNYAFASIIHETGHALGFKHPHEASGSFAAMPVDHDSLEYSVMSYRSYIGASTSTGYTNGSSQLPADADDVRRGGDPGAVRRQLRHQRRRHRLFLEPDLGADAGQRRRPRHRRRQQDLHDAVGRRRQRHLRLRRLHHRPSPSTCSRAPGRPPPPPSSPRWAAATSPPATSPTRCSTTTTPPR